MIQLWGLTICIQLAKDGLKLLKLVKPELKLPVALVARNSLH